MQDAAGCSGMSTILSSVKDEPTLLLVSTRLSLKLLPFAITVAGNAAYDADWPPKLFVVYSLQLAQHSSNPCLPAFCKTGLF